MLVSRFIDSNNDSDDYYSSDGTKWLEIKSTKRQGILLGYEYEVETKKNIPLHLLPNGFQCEKEPFHNNSTGWEIKSPVAPLFYHKLLYKKLPSNIPWNWKPNGKGNYGGIHVHINKDGTRFSSRDKLMEMLSSNKERVFQLSGRNKETFDIYARFDGCCDCGDPDCDEDDEDSHYNILNSEHDRTYEFRMFAAHPTLLMSALEMADSMFTYADSHDDVTWDGWVSFIKRWPRYRSIANLVKQKLPASTMMARAA